jgi:hypothetical protein
MVRSTGGVHASKLKQSVAVAASVDERIAALAAEIDEEAVAAAHEEIQEQEAESAVPSWALAMMPKRGGGVNDAPTEGFYGARCEVCDVTFTGRAQLKEHLAGRKHASKLMERVYVPAERRAMYCRVCQLNFETVEELEAHRETSHHFAAVRLNERASYCYTLLFTS